MKSLLQLLLLPFRLLGFALAAVGFLGFMIAVALDALEEQINAPR